MSGAGEAMEPTEKAWPFVVTRNRLLDWRPIIAPDFMVKQGSHYLLTYESAGEEDDPATGPRERVISTESSGPLTLIFSSRPAIHRLLGEPSDQVLVDREGRQIRVTVGLVLVGSYPGALDRWRNSLNEVEQMATEAFPKFWAEEDETTAPVTSQPITSAAQVTSIAPPTRAPLHTPGHSASTVRRWAPVLIGAAAFAFIVVIYLLIRGRR